MLFKCRNCGGNIVYDPVKKAMCCPHCESLDSEEKLPGSSIVNNCPNCGAPIVLKEHTSATKCPSCGSYLIIDERVQEVYEPELIIPFKLGKNQVKEILYKEFGKRPFTPAGFLSYAGLEKMEGNYVPFFMYDYSADINYSAVGTKVRSWTSGSYRYTETSYFDVVREMDADFEKVPVDASVEMDDTKMDLMEPYKYGELEKYQDKYLSGFYAEKYNMPSTELEGRAEEKVQRDSEELLKSTLGGYATLTNVNKSIRTDKKGVKYALLPVWEYIFGYGGTEYKFMVNGQTGKVVGTTPVAKGKVIAYGATVFGLVTLIGFMIRMALMAL
ncbi:MAG: hypothetical protein K6G69_07070 [Lachnospiraceae bacterium]|nr:hypothetical protein [Lachnospiraceae bacterium]